MLRNFRLALRLRRISFDATRIRYNLSPTKRKDTKAFQVTKSLEIALCHDKPGLTLKCVIHEVRGAAI